MLTDAQRQKIEEVLNDMIDEREMFTAFDITTQVRNAGIHVYHSDVRVWLDKEFNEVLSIFADDYERNSRLVSNNVYAFVYHPDTKNVDDYDKDRWQSTTAVSTDATDDTDCITKDDSASDDVCIVDGRNRLCVPAANIRRLGVKAGGRVCVYPVSTGQEVVVVAEASLTEFEKQNLDKLSILYVDKSDNLRLGQNTLNNKGLSGSKFVVKNMSSSKIIIVEA